MLCIPLGVREVSSASIHSPPRPLLSSRSLAARPPEYLANDACRTDSAARTPLARIAAALRTSSAGAAVGLLQNRSRRQNARLVQTTPVLRRRRKSKVAIRSQVDVNRSGEVSPGCLGAPPNRDSSNYRTVHRGTYRCNVAWIRILAESLRMSAIRRCFGATHWQFLAVPGHWGVLKTPRRTFQSPTLLVSVQSAILYG